MKVILLLILSAFHILHADVVDVYFGTGGGEAKGIYRASLDTKNGKLSSATIASEVNAPGFLAFHPDRTRLYAIANPEEGPAVLAYNITDNGELELLNFQLIPDGRAAHISVHPSGKFLLTAQYRGGSVAVFPLGKDGHVEACNQTVKHKGASGIVTKRQSAPHPHWVGFSPDGRFAFVPDLGLDKIVVYKVQLDQFLIKRVGAVDSVPGGGPRHMKFSVDGQYIFLLNELSLSVSTFAYDEDEGKAELLTTTSTLSDSMKAKESFNSSSEIVVHPNGQFVYAANRGHDSVTAFQIDPETGRLYVTDIEPIRGAWPRNINLDTSGQWLLAAGAHSNTVTVLEVHAATGALTYPRDSVITVPNVICVLLND
ncbi:MAG: lactonase family protein [Verrucomicrobiota bacterium]|nr:lactonase family protein [Verrucomicrobiota bacterium]MEE2988716.1 lactonase family protein [Verrucomicrobiota bacterium]